MDRHGAVRLHDELPLPTPVTPKTVSSTRSFINHTLPLVSPAVSQRIESQDLQSRKKPSIKTIENDPVTDNDAFNSITNRISKEAPVFCIDSVSRDSRELIEIKIQCNDGKPRSFVLNEFINGTIGDIKRELFEEEMKLNKTFRVIHQGKLLKDSDLVANLKVDSCKILHFFLTEKHKPEVKSIQTEAIIDTKMGLRGFDLYRDFAFSEEDIIWKRFRFHNEYILVERLEFIDDDFLVNREEQFLSSNQSMKLDHQKFKKFDFTEENQKAVGFFPQVKSESPLVFRFSKRVFLFLVGFVFFFFGFFLVVCCAKARKVQVTEYQWIFWGSSCKLLVSSALFILFNKFYYFIPPFW